MKRKLFALVSILCGSCILMTAQETIQLKIRLENPNNRVQKDAPVVIRLDQTGAAFQVRSAVVMDDQQEIPSELDDLNGDLKADELAFVIDMPAYTNKELTLTLSSAKLTKQYPARVFAQMLARDAKNNRHAPVQSITVPGTTDFYSMVHGHGPMFESELVGYRVYFNEKQTLDPYGKFNKGMELKESQFYPNDEQLARGFGALKGWDGQKATHVAPVAFRTERILAYGPIRTVAEVEAKGWEYQGKELTMTHRYILYAGHRDLRIETTFAEPLEEETFCTGVQNIMGNETISYSDHKGLVGSWGRHWPVNDTVKYAKETIGIATYIPQKYVRKEVKDKDNFLYTVSAPGSDSCYYYTMFTSRKETFGYPTSEAWFKYMQEWKEELENPIKVTIIR